MLNKFDPPPVVPSTAVAQISSAEELLSPSPSHKLLVLAAPLRVHNQTDLFLVLRRRFFFFLDSLFRMECQGLNPKCG